MCDQVRSPKLFSEARAGVVLSPGDEVCLCMVRHSAFLNSRCTKISKNINKSTYTTKSDGMAAHQRACSLNILSRSLRMLKVEMYRSTPRSRCKVDQCNLARRVRRGWHTHTYLGATDGVNTRRTVIQQEPTRQNNDDQGPRREQENQLQ